MKTLSEHQLAVLLLGKRVRISVGEPWNFEGPEGPGRLGGEIVEVRESDGDIRQQAIEVEVAPFTSEEGPEVTRLTTTRRYADSEGIIEQLASGERVPANFSYSDQVPEELRTPHSFPGLIGSISLAEN